MTYQIAHKKLINVVAMISDPSRENNTIHGPTAVSVSQEEALATFAGWEPQVQALLKVRILIRELMLCSAHRDLDLVHQEAHEICAASNPTFG